MSVPFVSLQERRTQREENRTGVVTAGGTLISASLKDEPILAISNYCIGLAVPSEYTVRPTFQLRAHASHTTHCIQCPTGRRNLGARKQLRRLMSVYTVHP